ncbi:hypothetical protein DICPUDRAFT_150587 [Dictyostelium purpureum]|uniref:Cytochrome P450 family protein n=1 Tax=Dictyostelium purpureum TaxID=5786 RepID=F0ZGQ3_DICPU|nr:uncharacterized protein DICPUDRAFT_150587 [Dictyostelium purpureum]EGC36886.1 hypothetical protein DICPUDRAFT_150587 [Dictyostelium purpureum]|eukprot:XP_003286608.1 hypothetical protein DICPUDRAFT_150587 [Dictyostelium purpureum]
MSSTTISAMIMGAADGDLNYLNSTPIGSSLLDDMGLDEDDFQTSTFDVYIPEKYDSKLMSDFEYISKNANRFLDTSNNEKENCTNTCRDYAIQGEILKFFIIVRPPNDSKKKQKQQKIQELLKQKQNQQTINQINTSTPPPTKLNVTSPTLVVSDTNSSENIDSNNNNNNNNNNIDSIDSNQVENVTVLQPSTSSSQNLLFELQLRLASDYEKSTKDNQNPLNIIDYNPKHTFVNTEMRNDHISSSKSVTSYLRQNTLNVPNNNSNNNNSNSNSNNNNNNKFLGDIIEINSPLTFKDPSSTYQKPNFFRLSNGDVVFPIEVPIYIREINEDKLITMVIKINRPKNNRNNNIYNSMDNKLERLTQAGMNKKTTSSTVGSTALNISSSNSSSISKTILKNFQLIQPMKIYLQTQQLTVPIGNRNLVSVTLENTHPTLPITIKNLDIYLFHVLNMESLTLIDTIQGQTSVPIHRQIGNLVKVNEHYIIKNLTSYQLPIQLEPSNQYSMVLSVEPTSVQKVLQPMDGFHTKVKLSWEIPSSCGQILSLYELKVNPPFTTDLMVSTDNKSPVTINEKFFVKFNISNLSNSSKNLTIIIPPPVIKQNQSVVTGAANASVGVTTTPATKNDSSNSNNTTNNKKSGSNLPVLKSSSSGKLINNTPNNNSSSNSTPKYVPVESHIQFSEMGNRSLLAFDEIQRNSVNLLCLEKSVHIGPVEPKNSISVSIEFIPLSNNRIYEINKKIPGPGGVIIFGNLLDLKFQVHEKLYEWYKKYGPVYRVRFGSVETVVLTEYSTLKSAFIDQSEIFHSRYERKSRTNVNKGLNIANSNGEYWSLLKNTMMREMTNNKLKKQEHVIEKQSFLLCEYFEKQVASTESKISSDPINNIVKMYSFNVILTLLFNVEFPYSHNSYQSELISTISRYFKSTGLPFPSDFIPILYPLLKNKPKQYYDDYASVKKLICKITDEHLEKNMGGHSQSPNDFENFEPNNIMEAFLKQYKLGKIPYDGVLSTLMDIILAGSDTSGNTILFAIIALANHPSIQEKLYNELKSTVNEKVSYYSDWKLKTPYLLAVIKEVKRLYPAAPISVPHCLSEDTIILGHKIAKGTQIIQNIFSTHISPKNCLNPLEFCPERFLSVKTFDDEPKVLTFGIGSRTCVGSALADFEIYSVLAHLFRKFKFSNPDPNGHPLNDRGEFGLALQAPNTIIKCELRN